MATPPKIFKKLKALSPDEKPHINTDELYMASKLVSRGVKKKELRELSVQDVYNGDLTIKNRIEKLPCNIPDDLVDDLTNHAKHLHKQNKFSSLPPDSPLLPSYNNDTDEKNMSHHLKSLDSSFNKIRKAGVIEYHQKLRRHTSSIQADKQTATQFRLSERQVKAILTDTIQRAGRPSAKSPEGKVIAALDEFVVLDLTKPEDYDEACQKRDEVLAKAVASKSRDFKGLCEAVAESMNEKIIERKGLDIKDDTDASVIRYERFEDLFDLLPVEQHDDKLDFD